MDNKGLDSPDSFDIQSKILQTTLAEVAAREDSVDCCVICLEPITEACEARPCSHSNFDYICLLHWLQEQIKCPLCKANIQEVQYDLNSALPSVYTVPQRAEPESPITPSHLLNRGFGPYAAPRRPHRRRPPPRPLTEDEVITRRREIYRNQTYSLHVGTNRLSSYRDITPESFTRDSGLVSKARTFLRRELKVFDFLNPSSANSDDVTRRRRANNAEFLLEYIIAILKTVDIQGSQGQAQELVKDYVGADNAKLLLHELRNFLRSPYSLEAWDRTVQYRPSDRTSPYIGQSSEHTPSGDQQRLRHGGNHGGNHGRNDRVRMRGDSYRPRYSRSDRR